jgi:hypothetical protein
LLKSRQMLIKLTKEEIIVASQVGILRQTEDIEEGKKSVSGEKPELAWQRHIEGALTECAMAKYLNVYWNKRPWPHPDVGNIDVRSTHWSFGDLRIEHKDPNERKFYLLTGLNGTYIIRGWMYAKDGKQHKYLKTYDKNREMKFFIPQSHLNHDKK